MNDTDTDTGDIYATTERSSARAGGLRHSSEADAGSERQEASPNSSPPSHRPSEAPSRRADDRPPRKRPRREGDAGEGKEDGGEGSPGTRGLAQTPRESPEAEPRPSVREALRKEMAERRRRRREKLNGNQDREKDPVKRLLSRIRQRGGTQAVEEYLELRAEYADEGRPRSEAPLPEGTSSPTSAEFLSHAQGGYSGGLHAGIGRFVQLPLFVCEEVLQKCGELLNTRGGRGYGRVRYHLAVLSFVAGLVKERQRLLETEGASEHVEYSCGATADLDRWEIIVSMEKVARAILERFHFMPVEQGDTSRPFKSFARKIQRVFEDLDGLEVGGRIVLKRLGPAVETGDRTADCFGQRFTIAGSVVWNLLDELDFSPAPHVLPTGPLTRWLRDADPGDVTPSNLFAAERDLTAKVISSPDEGDGDIGLQVADVGALYDRLVPAREDVAEGFKKQAAKTAPLGSRKDPMTAPEREVEGIPWQQRSARTSAARKDRVRHVTVGAFREGHATSKTDRKEHPCTVPFVVFELDTTYERPRPALCYEAALRIGERLEELGMRPEDILGSFTGNESIHIRVPSGAIGARVFRTPSIAKAAILRFYDLVLDDLELPSGVKLDRGLANPLANIRAVGSVHERLFSRTYASVLRLMEKVLDLPHEGAFRAIEDLPFLAAERQELMKDFRQRRRFLRPHRVAERVACKLSRRRYCVSFYFDDVLDLETLQAYSTHYAGLTLKAPHRAERAEGLARLFDEAVRYAEGTSRQSGTGGDGGENRGIIEAILDGVAPGEEFHSGYVGRNYAALILSRYYVTHGYSPEEAREAVENWNASLEVPLGEHPEDDRGELDYVFRRGTRGLVSAAESLP